MKLKTIFHRAAAGALCLLLCACCLPQTALAVKAPGYIENFDPKAKCSLTLEYRAYPNVTFSAYRIASVDENVNFTVSSTYRQILSDWGQLDGDCLKLWRYTWWDLARLLKNHIEQRGLQSTRAGICSTGSNPAGSSVKMKIDNLEPGLYLVVGSSYTLPVQSGSGAGENDRSTVTPTPYLVCLPNWEPDGDNGGYWRKNVVSDLTEKVSVYRGSSVNIQVAKSWDDNGYTRPRSITVGLYQRGVLKETAVLSSANNWKYIWRDLASPASDWSIAELNVPSGYSHLITWVNDYNVAIANIHTPPPGDQTYPPGTYQPGTYPPGTYPPGVTPRPTSPVPDIPIDDPDVPLGNMTPPPVNTSPDEIELDDPDVPLGDLPQTGQLWWPVPILAGAGVLLMLVGLVLRRRGEYDEE